MTRPHGNVKETYCMYTCTGKLFFRSISNTRLSKIDRWHWQSYPGYNQIDKDNTGQEKQDICHF